MSARQLTEEEADQQYRWAINNGDAQVQTALALEDPKVACALFRRLMPRQTASVGLALPPNRLRTTSPTGPWHTEPPRHFDFLKSQQQISDRFKGLGSARALPLRLIRADPPPPPGPPRNQAHEQCVPTPINPTGWLPEHPQRRGPRQDPPAAVYEPPVISRLRQLGISRLLYPRSNVAET
jgi:hypothetical protein